MNDNNVDCWPDFYPEGTPPMKAIATNGESYRLVENCPPIIDDFKSTFEEYPNRNFRAKDLSLACGTSHYQEMEEIKKTRNLFRPLRNRMIAKGSLVEELGVMLNSFKPSHITVWYRKTAMPHTIFNVLEDEI